MFFNNCPCKHKYYEEVNQNTNECNYSQKQKCNLDCHQSKPIQKYPCDCCVDFNECYPNNKSRSECKFCIEGTIKFKNNSNLW